MDKGKGNQRQVKFFYFPFFLFLPVLISDYPRMVNISSVQILPSLSPQSDKNFVIFAGSGTKANLAGFSKK